MKKPTRFYSGKQEKQIANTLKADLVPNSGATKFKKGDLSTDKFLIEAKTATCQKSSFSIKKQWLEKLKEEAFAMNKQQYALAFNFGPDTENFYVLTEKQFKLFMELLDNANDTTT